MTQQNQPVHRIRIGIVSAAIFENQGQEGRPPFYNVTFERGIKTQEGWKTTRSFSRMDLLNVAKLADLAHTWITAKAQPNSGLGASDEE